MLNFWPWGSIRVSLVACLLCRDRIRAVSVSAVRFSLSLIILLIVSLNAPNQRWVTCEHLRSYEGRGLPAVGSDDVI